MTQSNLLKIVPPAVILAFCLGFVIGKRRTDVEFFRVDARTASSLSENQIRILREANEDMNLALKGKAPRRATQSSHVLDGGSVIYACPDYEITQFQKLSSPKGIPALMKGVGIKFKEDGVLANVPCDNASYTWMETQIQEVSTTSP